MQVARIKQTRRIRKNRVENIRFKETALLNISDRDVVELFGNSKMLHPVIHKICSVFAKKQSLELSLTRVQTWMALKTSATYLTEKESLCYGLNAYLHGYDKEAKRAAQIGRFFKNALRKREYADLALFSLALMKVNDALEGGENQEVDLELLSEAFLMMEKIRHSDFLTEVSAVFQAMIMILHNDFKCAYEILDAVAFEDSYQLHCKVKELVDELNAKKDLVLEDFRRSKIYRHNLRLV